MHSAVLRDGADIRVWRAPSKPGDVRNWRTRPTEPPAIQIGLPRPAPHAAQPPRQAEQPLPRRTATVAEAQQEAERIRAEAVQLAQEERERARFEGLSQGRATAKAELEQARAELGTLAASMQAQFEAFCRAQLPSLVELVSATAEQIARVELAVAPEKIETIVREAVERLSGATEVVVRLHPEDAQIIGTAAAQGLGGRLAQATLLPDAEIERGGCRLESRQGDVDATLSGRIARAREALKAA